MHFISKSKSKFVCFLMVLLGSVSNMSMAKSKNSPMAIIDFQQSQELDNWMIVNDMVMGGRSNIRVDIKDNRLKFSGVLSLENNGGFASVRRVDDGKEWLSVAPIQIKERNEELSKQLKRVNPKYILREWFVVPASKAAATRNYA